MKSLLNPKYVTFALLALAAGAALAGYPILPHEALAGLGMMPMMIGDTELLEVKRLIEGQGAAWEEFRRKNDARFKNIEDEISEFLTKENRRGLGGLLGGGNEGGDAEAKAAFFTMLRTGRETSELKSMMASSDPQGGYLIPTQLDSVLSKNLRDLSAMRQLASVVRVGGTELKQLHSTGGTGYTWVGETTSRPETAAPSLKLLAIATKECYAMPGVTQNLLDDNEFNLESWLLEELTETFGDAEGDAFINGDGIAKPRGLFTFDVVSTADATREHGKFQYIPSGAATTLTADALISLVHAVKPRYRQRASWLMSSEALEAVRKLKDGEGRYIWEVSLQAGKPSTLLGFPVFEDENVPAVGANSLSVAFGDFARAYTITDRSTAMLRDPYTQKPYVMFYAAKRVGGGGGRDTRAVKFLKIAAS